jgi:hypothetical protein
VALHPQPYAQLQRELLVQLITLSAATIPTTIITYFVLFLVHNSAGTCAVFKEAAVDYATFFVAAAALVVNVFAGTHLWLGLRFAWNLIERMVWFLCNGLALDRFVDSGVCCCWEGSSGKFI